MQDLRREVVDTARFAPTGASLDLVAQLAQAIEQINARRPLSDQVLKRLQTEILYDRVHSSAVTEGNRLSRRETIVVLTTGLVEAGSRRDQLEVRNLAEAISALEEALHSGEPLTGQLFRTLHSLLLADTDPSQAGRYREENVAISGAKVAPPHFHDVSDLVGAVLERVDSSGDLLPLQKAAWAHWAIARIHPFRDGNGRMSRLIQDYILLKHNFVPSSLSSEDREGGYYAALESADLGDGRPLLELIAKNCIRTADRYVSIISDEEAKLTWIASITKAATEKVRETEHRQFLSLQRASNILKTEFDTIAQQLEGEVPLLHVRLRDYGSLTFEQYHDIIKTGRAKRTWFFGVQFKIRESALRYIVWYGSHIPRPYDISASLPSPVVLLVSAEEEQSYYRLLDELEEDRVTLRELVPNQSQFWRRRYNPVLDREEWDRDLSAGQVARDFFQEVLSKLGLI